MLGWPGRQMPARRVHSVMCGVHQSIRRPAAVSSKLDAPPLDAYSTDKDGGWSSGRRNGRHGLMTAAGLWIFLDSRGRPGLVSWRPGRFPCLCAPAAGGSIHWPRAIGREPYALMISLSSNHLAAGS
jgi:hypothetical protein